MAKSRKDCLTEIAEKSGKSREEVGDAARRDSRSRRRLSRTTAWAATRPMFAPATSSCRKSPISMPASGAAPFSICARKVRGIATMRRTRRGDTLAVAGRSRNRVPAGARSETCRRQSAVSRQPPLGRRPICRASPAAARWLLGGSRSRRPAEGVRVASISRSNGPTNSSN